MASLSKNTEYLPLRTVLVILKNGNKSSTRTYVNEDVADCLGLEGEPVSFNVRVVNETTAQLRNRSVKFELESCDGRVRKEVAAQTTKRVICAP